MSEPEYNAYQRTDPYSAIPEVHLPWLLKVAGKFSQGPVRDSETFSDACLGLMRAVETYDPSKGVKFITYAANCVFMEMKHQRWDRRRRMMRKDGFPKLTEHRIGHNAPEPVQPKPDFQIDSSVLEMLPEALRHLDEQERTIIQMRLEGRLLREIGEELGFSKQRAEQVMKRAIANLRGVFRSFGVEEI